MVGRLTEGGFCGQTTGGGRRRKEGGAIVVFQLEGGLLPFAPCDHATLQKRPHFSIFYVNIVYLS